MKGAILYTWGVAVRGREKQSLEVFAQAMAHTDAQIKKGAYESSAVFFVNSGDSSELAGIQLITGDIEKLRTARSEEATLMLELLAGQIVEHFSVLELLGGDDETMEKLISMVVATHAELGLA